MAASARSLILTRALVAGPPERAPMVAAARPLLFERAFVVRAPLARVRAFHERAEALRELTPAPMRVHQPARVEDGAIARFSLYVPWRVDWVARHENVHPGGFDDVMVEGPFAQWRHEHRYRALDATRTEVRDRITAELGGAASRALWAGIAPAFAYRAWVTRRWCERRSDGGQDPVLS